MANDSSRRIVEGLTAWIATAPPDARLPSTRALVAQHGVSPVTVQKAMRRLAALGMIESRPGAGTFVRAVRTTQPHDYDWQTGALGSPSNRSSQVSTALRIAPNDVMALHSGYPDRELLPERLVGAAFGRAARSAATVTRPPAAGTPELQAWFATELGRFTPVGISPPTARDVVVLPGSQSGLGVVFSALVGAGRPLLVESPTYWGALLAANQANVKVIPVSSGFNGPDPSDVARAFAQTGARAFYAQPNFASPTGAQWSPALGGKVLDIIRENRAFLVEDDWAHDFGIHTESRPLAAHDDAGHVVYLRSLSKSVSPAVRVAAVVARGPARDRILAVAQGVSMYVSGLLQTVALDVVTQPSWRSHLRSLRHHLEARRDLLIHSLGEHAPSTYLEGVPKGGLNLWVRLPHGTDLPTLVRDCEAAGVIVAPGDEWFPAEATGPYLRLNYAGPNPGSFPESARIIGRTLGQRRS